MKVKVKDQTTGKIYQYETALKLTKGTQVILNTGQSLEVGEIMCNECKCPAADLSYEQGEGEIERELTPEDLEKISHLKEKARDYLSLCEEKIKKYGLRMKLMDADLSLDESKITFYFGGSERVDFRELVLDLARNVHKVIRLQQIGSRDEARHFGGFGPCGQQICCARFLGKNLSSVTLESAKAQDMEEINVGKISGLCGKLMCCLSYEQEVYKELAAVLPNVGDIVKIKQGEGKVIDRSILGGEYTVKIGKDIHKVKVGKKKE